MTAARRVEDGCGFGKATRIILITVISILCTGIGYTLTVSWRTGSDVMKFKNDVHQEIQQHKEEAENRYIENVKDVSTMKAELVHIRKTLDRIEKKLQP